MKNCMIATAALLATASVAMGQDSCDQILNTGSIEVPGGGVYCPTGVTGIAKSYDLSTLLPGQAFELSCVEFGMSNPGGAVTGTINVYVDTNGGAPIAAGTDLTVLGTASVELSTGTALLQASFNPPLELAADGTYVVELQIPQVVTDFEATFGGNTGPDSTDTYIIAEACGLTTYASLPSINFPGIFWANQLIGDTIIDGATCDCFTGSDCFIANGTPGCDNPFCETLICGSFDDFCCTGEWDDTCAELALSACTFTPVDCPDFPAADRSEAEDCGADTNGGCNADPNAFETIAIGETVSGRFYVDATADVRDTDWYEFSLTETSNVTLSGWAKVGLTLLITGGGPCDLDGDGEIDVPVLASGSGDCPTVTSICLPAGEYRAFIAPNTGGENLPCDVTEFTGYVMRLEAEGLPFCPGQEPCPGGDLSLSPNSDIAVTQGLVACAGTQDGLSRDNVYAITMDLATGDTAGTDVNISCVTYGVSSSSAPIDAVLELWQDTDGGAPSAPGGADLVLLGGATATIYLGQGTQNMVFDPPICVPADSQLVVTISIPASTTGDTRAGGNALPSTSPTYLASETCGITTFTSTTDIGFPDNNWVVSVETSLSCDSGSCEGDFNNDGNVDGADFGAILAQWGPCSGCAGDLDNNGAVGGSDIGIILSKWGACP